MLRYKLRTLLILLAVFPPLIAGAWWRFFPSRGKPVIWLLRQDTILSPDNSPWTKATYANGWVILLPPGKIAPDILGQPWGTDPDSPPLEYYQIKDVNPDVPAPAVLSPSDTKATSGGSTASRISSVRRR